MVLFLLNPVIHNSLSPEGDPIKTHLTLILKINPGRLPFFLPGLKKFRRLKPGA